MLCNVRLYDVIVWISTASIEDKLLLLHHCLFSPAHQFVHIVFTRGEHKSTQKPNNKDAPKTTRCCAVPNCGNTTFALPSFWRSCSDFTVCIWRLHYIYNKTVKVQAGKCIWYRFDVYWHMITFFLWKISVRAEGCDYNCPWSSLWVTLHFHTLPSTCRQVWNESGILPVAARLPNRPFTSQYHPASTFSSPSQLQFIPL